MKSAAGIKWTNRSVLALAGNADPVLVVQNAAQSLVLKALEAGWKGPPFSPLRIVEMLGARVSANANIADARLIASSDSAVIEYNPQQPRERVRFSIAHEVAHMLFADWRDGVRNRGGDRSSDDWQLEMLCNIAASEIVLPIGSLPPNIDVSSIEDLMRERRRFDVSVEAFLIRFVKVADRPMSVFFASSPEKQGDRVYHIDYSLTSPLASQSSMQRRILPSGCAARNCTAIGHTDRAIETWFSGSATLIEYVGIPGFPGTRYPRVAGIVRHQTVDASKTPLKYVHGDVMRPLGYGSRIVCQLVNDRATRWGGGVAKRFASLYPDAEQAFSDAIKALPLRERLGQVIFTKVGEDMQVASIIAQEGFGPSLFPRVRYKALQTGLAAIAVQASSSKASVHMPRIGTGSAGGDWSVVEEFIDDELVREGVSVIVYDLPPRRQQFELFTG